MNKMRILTILAGALAFGGCASQGEEKGAAQVWGENCARCHNSRSPSTYSDAEWDVAVQHMRVRAPLTAEEHKKIAEFLKAGN